MNEPCGLYVHIPFCQAKCPYCDFYSKACNREETEHYVNHLVRQMEIYGNLYSDKKFDTLYIGGGTPSVIGTDNLFRIVETAIHFFSFLPFPEITVEMNPCSAKHIDFEKLRSIGVNRISLGVQSANERELHLLGRIHNNSDVIETVTKIHKADIENISMDLMLGISEQTIFSLQNSIRFCIDNGAKHISAYLLKIEPDTPYQKLAPTLSLPDEDTQADFYEYMQKFLTEKGYRQYEISNFSFVGFESRHNLKYWNCDEYLGIGVSAHSLMNGRRFYFPRDMQSFYDGKTIDDGNGSTEQEYIMLRLRLSDGICFREYQNLFGKKFPERYLKTAQKYSKYGLVNLQTDRINLTPKGFLLSNTIIAEMLE